VNQLKRWRYIVKNDDRIRMEPQDRDRDGGVKRVDSPQRLSRVDSGVRSLERENLNVLYNLFGPGTRLTGSTRRRKGTVGGIRDQRYMKKAKGERGPASERKNQSDLQKKVPEAEGARRPFEKKTKKNKISCRPEKL